MAKSPLQSAQVKWQQRTLQARQRGIPDSVVTPLAQYDINKVAAGGTGMTDQEAMLAIVSAGQGQPVIQDPKPKHGLLDILGNVPSDVTGIVKGFIPGMVHDVTHIGELPGAVAHAGGELASGKIAQGAQDLAKAPGLGTAIMGGLLAADFVPGLDALTIPLTGAAAAVYGGDVAAKATTAKGRAELAQHPVGSALEALPAIDVAGDVSKTALGPAEEGSSLEALQSHRPIAAIGRAIPAGKMETDVGAIESANLAERMGKLAQRLNIDKTLRGVSRDRSVAARQLHGRMTEILKQSAERIGKMTEEESARYYDLATGVDAAKLAEFDPHDPTITGLDNASILEMRKVVEEQGNEQVRRGTLVRVPYGDKEYLYPVTSGMAKRMEKINTLSTKLADLGQKEVPTDPVKALEHNSRVKKVQARLIKEQRNFQKAIYRDLPANLHDFAQTRTRVRTEEEVNKVVEGSKDANPEIDKHIRSHYQADQLANLTRDIQNSTSWQDFAKIVGEKNFKDIYRSVAKEAIDLSQQGFDPLYLRHVPITKTTDQILNPKPLSEGYISDRTVKSRVLNFGPHYHDAALALSDGAREMLSADASRAFVDNTIRPLSEPVADLKDKSMKAMADRYNAGPELRDAVAKQLDKSFVAWDPSGPFTWHSVSAASESDLAIPRYLADGIDKMLNADRKLAIQGSWDKGLKVYKFSVLTGPRHVVHVAVGGTMFMALRDPMALAKIPAAIKMVRDKAIPDEVPQQLYDSPGEHLFEYSGGKTVGRILMAIPNGLKHFEETAANIQRAAAFLSASAKGLDTEAAALEASKIFVNLDDMLPIERTIIKNWMPFYAFTRHLFRYLFTYPVDHPIRAAILARFAEQEQEDWNSGLPKQMQQLFFLGSGPNQTAVDFKSINPFRSFGNDFSLAGIVSGMNPAIQLGATMAGINPLSAAPELYPQVSYDTQTGSLTADRPHSGDWPGVLLEEFVPPTQALDHYIGFTDRLRNLKTSNPEAFRRQLFSSLNIPFDWANVNIPLAQEKAEIHRYQAAQKAVQTGTKTGSFSEAQRFNAVPYQGNLVDPQQLSAYWDQLLSQLSGTGLNPKAVLKPPKRKRVR